MNITLLGHHDIAGLYAMHRILHGAPEHRYSVFLSGPASASEAAPDALRQLAATDRELCDTFLHSTLPAPGLVAAADLPAPNSPGGLATLQAAGPDLIVSIRYRRILKDAAIAIPRHGVLNLHSGILPNYRGVMATFWAMLNDEPEIGSTLHRIVDSGIDTGPVITVSRQPTRPRLSYLANVVSLYDAGCAAILAAIDSIGLGNEPPVRSQTVASGAYFSTPIPADLQRFHDSGLQLASGDELQHLNART